MKILVVIDMQNDFVDGALGSKEALAIVPAVCKKIESDEFSAVFVTKDTHYSDYFHTLEGKKLPVQHCVLGTPGWELNKDVKASLEKMEFYAPIHKSTFGAKNLPQIILATLDTEKEEDPLVEIEICGLCTDICVVSNALLLRANFPDTIITVDASCCAGVTPEKHKAALEVMKSCQIDVVNE